MRLTCITLGAPVNAGGVLFFVLLFMTVRVFDKRSVNHWWSVIAFQRQQCTHCAVGPIRCLILEVIRMALLGSRWPFLENLTGSYALRSLPPFPLTEGGLQIYPRRLGPQETSPVKQGCPDKQGCPVKQGRPYLFIAPLGLVPPPRPVRLAWGCQGPKSPPT